MKKLSTLFYLAALMLPVSLVSCEREADFAEPEGEAFTVSVEAAADAESKTYVEYQSRYSRWHFVWGYGDRLRMYHFNADDMSQSEVVFSNKYTGYGEDNATFTATFPGSVSATNHLFVGVHASETEDLATYTPAYDAKLDAVCLGVTLPSVQHLTSDNYDTMADIMVSEPYAVTDIPSSFKLTFARVGTLAVIHIKNFAVTGNFTRMEGKLTTGNSFAPAGSVKYNPLTRKFYPYALSNEITFDRSYPSVTADGLTVYLRTLAGELTDEMTLEITLTHSSGKVYELSRRVDLAAAGRVLEFREGGVTEFSVALDQPRVTNAGAKAVAGTEATIRSELTLQDGDALEQAFFYYGTQDYGTVDAWKASGTRVVADGIDSDNPYRRLTGLTADTQYYFISGARIGGKEYYAFNATSFHTLRPETPAPLVDLGLPSGTKWAQWNLGCSAAAQVGDFYAYGETAPKDEYSWDNYLWGSGVRSFTKYSYSALFGKNNLVDLKMILEPEDDAATVRWGSEYRTPTMSDWSELNDNCTVKNKNQKINGQWIGGYEFTGPNGNTIWITNDYGSYGYLGADLLTPDSDSEFTNGIGLGRFGSYWGSSALQHDAGVSFAMYQERALAPGLVRPVSAEPHHEYFWQAETLPANGSVLRARFPGWDALPDNQKHYPETFTYIRACIFYSTATSADPGTGYNDQTTKCITFTMEDLEKASGGVLSKDCGISGPVYYRAFLSVRSPHPTDTPTIIWAEGFGATMKAN